MPTLLETRHQSEAIVSEAKGERSREKIVMAAGAGKQPACTVVGKITANSKYLPVNPGAGDGTQVAAGLCLDPFDATSVDVQCGALVRDCEINNGEINWGTLNAAQITAARAQLASVGVIVRDALG